MRKQSFVLSAIILSLGGFFAKAIGALYKIPLTNILGASGMGLYYLIFPIYSLVITICSSGIAVALATEVAKCRKIRHRYNEQILLRVSLVLGFGISLVFAILVIIFSDNLAFAQGNINAKNGYIVIAPAIIISTLIATLRGYFQGIENMVPTTVSMIIEQIIKLGVGLILAHKLCIYGVSYAVLGAILGVTVSEIVALIIIAINFVVYKGQLYYNYRNLNFKHKKKIKVKPLLKRNTYYRVGKLKYKYILVCNSQKIRYSRTTALRKIVKTMLPSTLASILIPISSLLDSFMIINILIRSGFSTTVSTSLYGLNGGVVQSLISIPTIIVTAISTSIVPTLSGLSVYNNPTEINRRITLYIKINWVISLLMFIFIFVFSQDILAFLYGEGLANNIIDEMSVTIKMLKISSVAIIYYSFLNTFTTILQTVGKSHVPFFAMLMALIIRTLLVVGLVKNPQLNIFGAIIANILFLSLATIILVLYMRRLNIFEFRLYQHLFKPLIIGTIILFLSMLIRYAIDTILGYFLAMLVTATITLIVSIIWIYFGKVFSDRELQYLKFKKKRLTKSKK